MLTVIHTMMNSSTHEWLPLGTTLALITKKYFGVLSQSLKHLDLDRNFSVLLLLDHENRAVSQQYIADYFLIDKVQMVRIVDHLSKAGMISKKLNSQNRRAHLISLTPKAIKLIPEIKRAIDQINKKMFSDLSESNKQLLFESLAKISTKLDAEVGVPMMMQLKPVQKAKSKA